MKIQESSGCIYSFVDLTDGGQNNYLGVNGYNQARSLIHFRGREAGNQAFAKSAFDWSARYTYALSGDGSTFTMTYSDVAGSGSYLYNSGYADGAASVAAGDVLADITVTINAPDANGTRIGYSLTLTGQKTDAELISRKYLLHQQTGVYNSLADGRGVGVDVTRSLSATDLEWAQASIDASANNAANGFTAGRTFTLARLTGGPDAVNDVNGLAKLSYNGPGTYDPAVAPAGQSLSNLNWAAIDTMQLNSAAGYSPALPGDFVKTETGYLDINIVPEPATLSLLALGGLMIARRRRR